MPKPTRKEVSEEEWDRISDEFARSQAGRTSSFAQAMENITRYMSQYKIVPPSPTKKIKR